MTMDERLEEAKLSIFIPASQAAICADCGGIFLLAAGHCPGCSSRQWVLVERARVFDAELMEKLERGPG